MNLQTLKGFRDFLPQQAKKRQYVINILKEVFESFGFEPLETPALEYEEILTGKYGEEGEKLMYRFEDHGKRKVAMRYDQTVPLARVVAQYQNQLPFPFKRYQIQNVWRADNTQKGRFREFIQCDIDIVGNTSLLADAEIIAVVNSCLKNLGFDKYEIQLNDRKLLFEKIKVAGIDEKQILLQIIREIDKIDKIGWKQLRKNLLDLNLSEETVQRLDTELSITQPIEQDPYLDPVITLAQKLGVNSILPKKYLARGLDYYTGLIFEVKLNNYTGGSVCGGGRFDNLIGMFAAKQIPAVGCAFGFDRIIEAMDTLQLFPQNILLSTSQVLVTIFNNGTAAEQSLEVTSLLRTNNIATEIWVGEIKVKNPLEKQLKYADEKGIPYVVIMGPEELKNNTIILKDLKKKKQMVYSSFEELLTVLSS